MECLIISGMSGAGKSLTVDVLEDIGFYCIDNMPVAMIPYFAELFPDSRYKRIAFVVDARGGLDSAELFSVMEEMRRIGVVFRILFIDASDDVLVNRQRESRRRHPLDWQGKGLVAAINEAAAARAHPLARGFCHRHLLPDNGRPAQPAHESVL